MSFLSPKVPTIQQAPPVVSPSIAARGKTTDPTSTGFTSMISTSTAGLTRKAKVRKNSLLGGSNEA